jgi:hypothetical protein
MCIFNQALQLKTRLGTSDSSLLHSVVSAAAAAVVVDGVSAFRSNILMRTYLLTVMQQFTLRSAVALSERVF